MQKEVYEKLKKPKPSNKKEDGIDLEEEEGTTNFAQNLIEKMQIAYINDKENLLHGKPGL